MNLKTHLRLFISYIIIFILVTFWVVTVFSTDLIFEPQISKKEFLSENIFLDDSELKQNYISFESNSNLSKYNLSSVCKINSQFIWEKDDKYLFKFKYLDSCNNWTLFLETKEKVKLKKSFISVKLFNKSKLFDLYVDNNDFNLQKINIILTRNVKKIEKILNNSKIKNFKYLKLKRKLQEFKYHQKLLKTISDNRNKKYGKLVPWYNISKKHNVIPNAGRPYRASYTDGIHHGWDIMAPLNTPVVSLDYGKIVKIVSDFKYLDLNKIKRWKLNRQQKTINLDILRWNQVWVKTSKWDVVFYSHLRNIPDTLKVWDIVSRNTKLWEVGISGVPDRNYKNYHLHFPIMKNPYLKNKIWKYSLLDYMKWDWYFKWKSLEYVSNNSSKIFK